jgi:hypothetical protein
VIYPFAFLFHARVGLAFASDLLLASQRRNKFPGFERTQSAKTAAEFGGIEFSLAKEPAQELFCRASSFFCVASVTGRYEVAVRIAAEFSTRDDMLQATPTWNHAAEAIKAPTRFPFVNRAAQDRAVQEVRFRKAYGADFLSGARHLGQVRAANFRGQSHLHDVTVFAAFDQSQCTSVDEAMKGQSSSPWGERNAVPEPCERKAKA